MFSLYILKYHVHARAPTQLNISEDSAKPYIFNPVAKSTETNSAEITKIVTMRLTTNLINTEIALQY